jgi:fucose permease
VFLNSVGLSQAAVGVSQAVFMAVAMLFDVPSGWLADRFSRKLSNCFGDLLVASGLFYYATVHSMLGVICAEILIGAGIELPEYLGKLTDIDKKDKPKGTAKE